MVFLLGVALFYAIRVCQCYSPVPKVVEYMRNNYINIITNWLLLCRRLSCQFFYCNVIQSSKLGSQSLHSAYSFAGLWPMRECAEWRYDDPLFKLSNHNTAPCDCTYWVDLVRINTFMSGWSKCNGCNALRRLENKMKKEENIIAGWKHRLSGGNLVMMKNKKYELMGGMGMPRLIN